MGEDTEETHPMVGDFAEVFEVVRIYWPLLLGNVLEWYEFFGLH